MDIPVRASHGFSRHSESQDENFREINLGEKDVRETFLKTEGEKNTNWTERILEFAISVSLVAIFFGIPLFFTGFTSQGISFEKQMYFYFWILIALIAWTSNGVIKGEMKIRRTPLDIPIIIFWLVYLLATIFSVDKWHSFWGFFGDPTHGFVNVTASIIVFYLILSHFNLRRFKLMLGSIIASGFAVVIWEILIITGALKLLDQNFISAHSWAQYLPVSPFGSISGAAVFLGVLIIILITAFLKTKASKMGKMKKIALLSVFLMMILASLYVLLALYFFVPWPAIFVGVGFFLIYVLARIIVTDSGSVWLPMGVFMVVLGILLVGNVIVSNSKIVSVQLPVEINQQHKFSWEIAKESMKNSFFLGNGPAIYEYAFSLYHPQEFNLNNLYSLQFYQGSGVLWEVLPTIGALGTFAFLLLLISFLGVSIYILSRDKGKNKVYSLGVLSAVLIILIAAFLIRIDGAMVILGVLLSTLALGIILAEGSSKEEYINLSLKASPKYALALAFVFLVVSAGVVFLFVFLGRVYAADILVGMASRQKNMNEDNSAGRILKAANLYNREGRYFTMGGQVYIALANSEFSKGESANTTLITQYLDNSVALASRGRELMPKDITAALALAQAYENKATYSAQFFDQAISSYNDALVLKPHSPDTYLKIGQLKAKQASIEKDETKRKSLLAESADMFQKSIDEKNNFASGYYYLSLIQGQMDDVDKALESAKNAYMIDNQDVNIVFNLGSLLQKKGGEENLAAAESLYQQILKVAPNDVNTHLSLGLLYEKQNKKDQAIGQYQEILNVLPKNSDQARTQIQTFIDNVRKGVSNENKTAQKEPEASNEEPSISVPENMETPEAANNTETTVPQE